MSPEWEERNGGQIRIHANGLVRSLRGYAIVFGRRSELLGDFVEIIEPQAIDRTLREGVDLRALWNHDTNHVLGRMSAGTLRVAKDAQGLAVEIDPPAHEAGVVDSVQRGDVTGMSFAFRVIEDDPQWAGGLRVRRILDMIVREVSIVAFPAYPDTSVALRSFDRVSPGRGSVTARLQEAQQPGRWYSPPAPIVDLHGVRGLKRS